MPELSILLPSLRRENTIKRIEEFSQTNGEVDYEIIVVSPFVVEGDRVIHVLEDEPKGSVCAQNMAYANSSGKYIVIWTDDISPTNNCLVEMLNFVKGKPDPFIGVFRVKRKNGVEEPQWLIYGKLQVCFGCTSRNTITRVGGYLDPVFKSFWSDPDLSLRTWEKGGQVSTCPSAWLISDPKELGSIEIVEQGNTSKYLDKDIETFLNRWHEKLGTGMPRDPKVINRPLYSSWRAQMRMWLQRILDELKFQVVVLKVNLLKSTKNLLGTPRYEMVKFGWYYIRGKKYSEELETE
ncbi:MAG: glycosyltransferase family 2 protein [Hormoscilla sp.]